MLYALRRVGERSGWGQQVVALLLIWWENCSLEIARRSCIAGVSEAVCLAGVLRFRGWDFIVAAVQLPKPLTLQIAGVAPMMGFYLSSWLLPVVRAG